MLCSFFVKSSSSHRLTAQIRHNDRNNASKFLYKLYCHIASCFAELMPVEGETLSKKLLRLLWGSIMSIRVNRASRLARWMTALATAGDLHASCSKIALNGDGRSPQEACVNMNQVRLLKAPIAESKAAPRMTIMMIRMIQC